MHRWLRRDDVGLYPGHDPHQPRRCGLLHQHLHALDRVHGMHRSWLDLRRGSGVRKDWVVSPLVLGGHRDPVQRCGPYMGLGVGGHDTSSNADAGWLAGLGFGFCAVGYAVTYKSALDQRRTKGIDTSPLSIVYLAPLCNIEDLRAIINRQAGWNVGNISVPFLWSLLAKFVIPPVLLRMLIMKMSDEAFGAYSHYPSFYQG